MIEALLLTNIFLLPMNWEDRPAWRIRLTEQVYKHLHEFEEAEDADMWCTQYFNFGPGDKVQFWAELATWISYYESSWNPHAVSDSPRSPGMGLFQMAKEECKGNLLNALNSIDCAVSTMAKLIFRDRTIATGDSYSNARGLARYWQVMRPESKAGGHRYQVKVLMLEYCDGQGSKIKIEGRETFRQALPKPQLHEQVASDGEVQERVLLTQL